MPRTPYDPSPDRQKLNSLACELAEIVQRFCDQAPLVRGNIKTLRRACGKPRCRCVRGKLHETLVFVNPGPPRRTFRKITLAERHTLRKPVKNYRSLRRLRVRLGRLHKEVLVLCDRLSSWRHKEGKRLLGSERNAAP